MKYFLNISSVSEDLKEVEFLVQNYPWYGRDLEINEESFDSVDGEFNDIAYVSKSDFRELFIEPQEYPTCRLTLVPVQKVAGVIYACLSDYGGVEIDRGIVKRKNGTYPRKELIALACIDYCIRLGECAVRTDLTDKVEHVSAFEEHYYEKACQILDDYEGFGGDEKSVAYAIEFLGRNVTLDNKANDFAICVKLLMTIGLNLFDHESPFTSYMKFAFDNPPTGF